MNDLAQLVQGSDAWLQARCGSLGASQIHQALAKTKTGWGASRDNLMADLICERLTGEPVETYQNADMLLGQQREPLARESYCWAKGVDVELVGMVLHPRIKGTHASPDALVPPDGLVEIKCPKRSTHLATLCGAPVDGRYLLQGCWQMACTGRQWVDLASFNPDFPPEMQLFVQRMVRDDAAISKAEEQVEEFLAELERTFADLLERYQRAAA
jgi:hypothetical protein